MEVSTIEDQKKETSKNIQDLEETLIDIPIDMRLFSLGMRSLYAEQAVGGSSDIAQKFRTLRDKTRDDAMVYLKGVLPVATKCVSSIKEYFDIYLALEYGDWKDMLQDIRQEVSGYKELAKTLVQMHEDILVPLKQRQDEAKIIVKQFKGLQERFESQKRKYECSASTKRSWAVGLMFIPVVGPIASAILSSSADEDIADAVANVEESKISAEASIAVSKSLIPALCNFIAGLEKIAGFFEVMEDQLGSLEDKASMAIEDTKMFHYKLMNSAAKNIVGLCQRFRSVLPAVRTDFRAIPTEGTDKSYVDKWLEEQKKTIRNRLNKKLADRMMKAITSGPASDYE